MAEHCWHWSGAGALKREDGTYHETLGEYRQICCWCGAKWKQIKTSHDYLPGEHGKHASWDRKSIVLRDDKPDTSCPGRLAPLLDFAVAEVQRTFSGEVSVGLLRH
jgi:hypothetical protein